MYHSEERVTYEVLNSLNLLFGFPRTNFESKFDQKIEDPNFESKVDEKVEDLKPQKRSRKQSLSSFSMRQEIKEEVFCKEESFDTVNEMVSVSEWLSNSNWEQFAF